MADRVHRVVRDLLPDVPRHPNAVALSVINPTGSAALRALHIGRGDCPQNA